ncbi:hypothetical protein C8A00DRAFT_37128 [Chaetomidium leptoderma]|uniref:Uncharacterized protein n=1 Tax=Chaetomidium leptoderma TaxID=669021 RepID=A0AAN6ZSJ6_9PEZI|nr:hypothetical protein C8A00DRAFT_37128 [Chaetomidium leptoderma]
MVMFLAMLLLPTCNPFRSPIILTTSSTCVAISVCHILAHNIAPSYLIKDRWCLMGGLGHNRPLPWNMTLAEVAPLDLDALEAGSDGSVLEITKAYAPVLHLVL